MDDTDSLPGRHGLRRTGHRGRRDDRGGGAATDPDADRAPRVYLVTGIQAAGKSTVAQALAERLSAPSVHVHGDQFRRWIVNGRRDMTPDPHPEAVEQLRLRYRLMATTCDLYAGAGCSVVAQDVVLGSHLRLLVDLVRTRPLHVVVLAPRPAVVAERERRRGKHAYGDWTVDGLDGVLRRDTPRLGLWLDTSELTVDQTCDAILGRSAETSVGV
ncbi:MAG TPA: AAA family ATPase [Pseudonocardia sp.]